MTKTNPMAPLKPKRSPPKPISGGATVVRVGKDARFVPKK